MCGISGIISFSSNRQSDLPRIVKQMNDTLVHRGPDDWGIYTNVPGTYESKIEFAAHQHLPAFALGHRRLSILDLSPAGRQPMVNNECESAIIFNGEIYNYIELREELSAWYTFSTSTDTEVLLKAYHRWGDQMFTKLDGMYAVVILDWKKSNLIAARDTIGIKPFYYAYQDQTFIFGSEPKAVLNGLGTSGHLDWEHASEFLALGIMDHDEGTFFREVKQLEGGHFLKLNLKDGSIKKVEYRKRPEVRNGFETSVSDLYRDVARMAINRQLRSDVPLGSSLSGGIDSSTIVSLAGQLLGSNAPNYKTLTFSFPGFKNDEADLAKMVAGNAGMEWYSVIPSLDTLEEDLEKMTINMGEPFSTLSMFAQYKVMESARQMGITVMLDGQGGDEVYLGYPRIAQRAMFHHLGKGNVATFFKEWNGLERNLSIRKLNSLLGNAYFNSKKIALTRRLQRLTPYVKKELLNAYRTEVADDVYASKNIYDKQWDELVKYCLPRLLKFADRNSMAFSVEQRVPHLAQPILDFALQLPVEYRVNNGWTKYNVRKAMSGIIPDRILWDNVKRGFDIPQGLWVERLSKKIENWVGALPDDTPLFKDKIIKDLKGPGKGEHYYWNVISLANFIHLTNVKN
jgi:asparagine synthase (glutamine-hydrolysing)